MSHRLSTSTVTTWSTGKSTLLPPPNVVVQNIQGSNLLHNTLSDYTSHEDALKKQNINGEHADISFKITTGQIGKITNETGGFSHAVSGANLTDRKRMSIGSLVGLFFLRQTG